MAEFDNIHRCTLGTSAFQLVDFKWREQPLSRVGLVVFKVAIEGHGYIAGDSPADLTSKLASVAESFRTPGQSFEVFGLGGGSLVALNAADCTGGGPLAGFELMEGMRDPPLTRSFRFTLQAERVASPMPGTPPGEDVPAERRLRTRPDGLRDVAWAGTMSGADLEARFIRLREKFRQSYPWRRWVMQYEFEQNAAGDFARVLIGANETAYELPGPDGDDGRPMVRDGDGVLRTERDEQMRLTRTWEYDVLVVGDPMRVRDKLRADVTALIVDGGVILREAVTFDLVQNRMRLSLETLAGGNGNALMNWTQSFRFVEPVETHEVVPFSSGDPVIIKKPPGIGRLVQTGMAVGAGVWILPPGKALEMEMEQPEIAYTHLNQTERQTTWTYVFAFLPSSQPRAGLSLSTLSRPAQPMFVTG